MFLGESVLDLCREYSLVLYHGHPFVFRVKSLGPLQEMQFSIIPRPPIF